MELADLRALLARLEIPTDGFSGLGVWRGRAEQEVAVHLSPAAFWRVVKLSGGEVKTEARCDLLYPYRHWITLEDVEFFTFSAEPILLPGTITPGYALRLT